MYITIQESKVLLAKSRAAVIWQCGDTNWKQQPRHYTEIRRRGMMHRYYHVTDASVRRLATLTLPVPGGWDTVYLGRGLHARILL